MHLKKTPQKNGRVNLSIVRSFREGGKPKTRTVKNLGYLDELERDFEDPIAHFAQVAAEMTREYAEAAGPQTITIHPSEKVDKRKCVRKNAGAAVPLCLYNSLGIEVALRNFSRTTEARFDLNAVMRLLVCERLLDPGSKLSAWQNKEHYFFRSDFSDDDVYRALDLLACCKDRIVSTVNSRIDSLVGRDMSHVFYDVTNHHFEIDAEDDLRRRGVAKNHAPKPLVQMGLLQDANAIPMGYRLFPGNTNDCLTMLDVLSDMKRDFKLERVVVVADKGLNCATNIAACVARGDGFVFSQSIRGTKSSAEVRAWVISDEGYAEQAGGEFKIKSRQDYKEISVEGPDGGKKKVRIGVKVVAFWSRKHAERARHERAAVVEKARQLAANPGAYSRATHFGAAKYVRNVVFDKATGEVIESGGAAAFDEEALARDEACDGYYCIITSETDMADADIVETYRGLWRIEESFKITKSDLSTRPVYVRTPAHIEAHFLVCYIALVIVRLIQLLCAHRHSAAVILDDLSKVSATHLEDVWWRFDHRTDLTDELFALIDEEAPRKNMRLKEIKGLFAKGKKISR